MLLPIGIRMKYLELPILVNKIRQTLVGPSSHAGNECHNTTQPRFTIRYVSQFANSKLHSLLRIKHVSEFTKVQCSFHSLKIWEMPQRLFVSNMQRKENSVDQTEGGSSPPTAPIHWDHDLPWLLWRVHILPFVGPGHYLWVGGTNRHFRSTYLRIYTPMTLYRHVYTVKQAQICLEDVEQMFVGSPDGQEVLCAASAYQGNQTVLEYQCSVNSQWDSRTSASAALTSRIKLLRWLHQHPFSQTIFLKAVAQVDAKILKWLHSQNCPWNDRMCSVAVHHGNLAALKCLRSMQCPWDSLLQWLHEQNCPFNVRTFCIAAARRDVEMLTVKCLHSMNFPWDERTCSVVARQGNLDILKWLRSKGCPWDARTTYHAAGNGHLEVLRWARANGCPWNASVTYIAAKKSQIETLQWSLWSGCPLRRRIFSYAAKKGQLELLQWLHAHQITTLDRFDAWYPTMLVYAALAGHVSIVKWLDSIGAPKYGSVCYGFAKGRHLTALKWARENGYPWDHGVCRVAHNNGDVELLRYLLDFGCPADRDVLEDAAAHGFGPLSR